MHNSSFIVIKDRINEILNSITVDDFYFGELKLKILEEFDLPEDYDSFNKNVGEVFLNLQKIEQNKNLKINSLKSSIEKIKVKEGALLKEIESCKLNIKELNDELQGIPSIEKDKKEEIRLLENEISIVVSLSEKEPYKTQLLKLESNKGKLEQWINSIPELQHQISESISILNKQLEIKKSDLRLVKLEISNENKILKDFINESVYQFDELLEAEAIKTICQYLYRNNVDYKLEDQDEYNSNERRYILTGYKKISITKNLNEISAPKSFFQHQNHDFFKDWRNVLLEIFTKPPDFTKIESVSYCESFPNWNFEIYSNPVDVNLFAATWMSFQNALQNKSGLMTKDGRLYLWITNSIFAEIRIRKQNIAKHFLGIFAIKEKDRYNKEIFSSQTDKPKVIGGYTDSGFFIPYGIYIIDNQISIEVSFHQNALLQETTSNILIANQLSSEKLMEDRSRNDDDDDD